MMTIYNMKAPSTAERTTITELTPRSAAEAGLAVPGAVPLPPAELVLLLPPAAGAVAEGLGGPVKMVIADCDWTGAEAEAPIPTRPPWNCYYREGC